MLDDDVDLAQARDPVFVVLDRHEPQPAGIAVEVLHAAALVERDQVAVERKLVDTILQRTPEQLVVELVLLAQARAINRVGPAQEFTRLVLAALDRGDAVVGPLVVEATVAATDKPVSAKIRLGYTPGTINIVVQLPVAFSAAAAVNAVMTVTEAGSTGSSTSSSFVVTSPVVSGVSSTAS